MKRDAAERHEENDGSGSERGSVTEEEEEDDQEDDVSVLSSLDNQELCLKYEQVNIYHCKYL